MEPPPPPSQVEPLGPAGYIGIGVAGGVIIGCLLQLLWRRLVCRAGQVSSSAHVEPLLINNEGNTAAALCPPVSPSKGKTSTDANADIKAAKRKITSCCEQT